jgi:hypothetical protein
MNRTEGRLSIMSNEEIRKWFTFPVAAAAYKKLPSMKDSLTHSYDPKEDRVLCGKVRPESILDDYCYSYTEAPTCPTCLKRLAKEA